MEVQLRPFANADLEAHRRWILTIDLDKFMSRSAPRGFEGTVDQAGPDYRWFVIVAGGRDVGTIWLERETGQTSAVRLGVFLGEESHLGKGIGRKAIDQVIKLCRGWFGFTRVRLAVRLNNARAIACYMACGFRQIGRGTNTDGRGDVISFITMEREA
jgi:RimJ/RimL family protein N-acetyltransferase